MKKKTSLFTIIALAGLMLFGFQSCSQYPDNEGITLVSKTNRLSQTWKLENYKLNDTDLTSIVAGYTESFTKEGVYSYKWGLLDGTGAWTFQNSSAEIKIIGIDDQQSKTLTILKLEEKYFWYYYMSGTDRHEYHMIK